MACCGFGIGYGGLGYGGCGGCGPCLQCYYPKLVDACPLQIGCGAIYPNECGNFGPCYGGISGPAVTCEKKKCCESSTCGCCLNTKKNKNKWFVPGTTVTKCACQC